MKERDEGIKTVTTEVRLKNSPLTKELDRRLKDNGKVYRYTYRCLIDKDFKEKFKNTSGLRSHLADKFGILTREANSIIKVVSDRINTLRELKKTQKNELEFKIWKLEKDKEKLIEKIEGLKERIRERKASKSIIENLRKKKQDLYRLNNKLNKLKQKLENWERIIKEDKIRLGFGGRRNFKKQFYLKENGFKNHKEWYEFYKNKRDHQLFYLGCVAEKRKDGGAGSQLARLFINKENGTLSLELRARERSRRKYYYQENIVLKYLKEDVYSIIRQEYKTALSMRFQKRGLRWYLQLIFAKKAAETITSNFNGTIGLDYNKGFIQAAETDRRGNLKNLRRYDLEYQGTGNKAKTEIRNIVKKIVKEALRVGKDIIIEDLDFTKLKSVNSKGKTKYSRLRNKDLHSFDYSRYKETFERACYFNGVRLVKVNPAYSSINGREKYAEKRKMTVHESASYIIARRGQNLKD